MPRLKYIYIIKYGDEIDAAFTVKYKMEIYLGKINYLINPIKSVSIWQLKDGGEGEAVEITDEYYE